ncbi:MAG TPA: beta-propeller domain-containing protein [Candidatus Dormibacteraeota bacterium]|nr:beta-propeller domain-containing protein [Candidatus Dormibacteraeota bacterium]
MNRLLVVTISTTLGLFAMAGCSGGTGRAVPTPTNVQAAGPKKAMQAFHSEQELKSYLRELAEKQNRQRALRSAVVNAPAAKQAYADTTAGMQESVTNVQHAGVDEGGIVKVHGNHLVVLRRGRLFTVAIGGDSLAPIATVDAFGPDIDPRGTWYDEMLVSQDTVVVIGYSYERGGTEVGLFHIDPSGKLAYRSTYHLRSNDYYSSRNYASRLIGSKLIFYAPLYMWPGNDDPFQSFPAVRKWHKGATPDEFKRIVSANQVFRPEHAVDSGYGVALHTVTTCDLSSGDFDCKATSVIGPPGRVFYVSPDAVYIWVTGWANLGEKMQAKSMVYRMPLDGSSPSAVGVSGSPVDQFSFLESEDGFLNVLVRSENTGDGMWGGEYSAGRVALLRMPLSSFSDGSEPVPPSSYQKLPAPKGYTFQNRFVGDYLLYGTGSGWGYPQKREKSTLYAVRWASGDLDAVPLAHGIDRIEQMGPDAVVVGTDGADLHFSSISLAGSPAEVSDYVRKGASQGELRSHGFFYKTSGRDSGMLGLPISLPGRPGYQHLFENSAAILFLRNKALRFEEVGELGAQPDKAKDDACRASCVDWYGNSQPLFVHGRIIALLGYEMVEGAVEDGYIRETRRVNYAPQNLTASRVPSEGDATD